MAGKLPRARRAPRTLSCRCCSWEPLREAGRFPPALLCSYVLACGQFGEGDGLFKTATLEALQVRGVLRQESHELAGLQGAAVQQLPPGPSALNSAIPNPVAPVAEGWWCWKAPSAVPFPVAVLRSCLG